MIEYRENQLDIDTYLALREGVHWKKLKQDQAKMALANSLYTLVAYKDGEPVGMGRLVGDGAVICYLQDMIVLPEVQGNGIGSGILSRIKAYVEQLRGEDTEMMFGLMCAKGREPFYEKHGFMRRPTEDLGPGMIQYLREDSVL